MDRGEGRVSTRGIAIGAVLILGLLLTVIMARGSFQIGTGLAFNNFVREGGSEYRELIETERHDAVVAAFRRSGMVYAATTVFSTTIPLTVLILAAIWTATGQHVRLRNILFAGLLCTMVAAVAMGLTSRMVGTGGFPAGFAGGTMVWVFTTLVVFLVALVSTRKKRRRRKIARDQNPAELEVLTDPRDRAALITANASAALDELCTEFPQPAVTRIIGKIKEEMKRDRPGLAELIDSTEKRVATEWAYSALGNEIGNVLESGAYHVYRGCLSSEGTTLLEVFDTTYNRLLQMNADEIDPEYAREQRATLRENIAVVG